MTLGDGSRLGRWRIEGVIGHGQATVVHRALDLRLGRRAALKVLVDEVAPSEDCRRKLLEAARAGADLALRGVVPILEAGEHSHIAYVGSSLIDGPSLATLLARLGRLHPQRCLVILQQVAEALDEAHARGVIHGGLKPTNVLMRWSQVRGTEEAYVSDFAVAQHLRAAAEPLMGRRLGPVHYLSPEQIQGLQPDPRTDVYLLGCLLYECLVGRPPFVSGHVEAVVSAHLGAPPPTPSSIWRELRAFDEVIFTALAKSPDDRHPSCRHLLAHAEGALFRLGPIAPPISPPPPPLPSHSRVVPTPAETLPPAAPPPPAGPTAEPGTALRWEGVLLRGIAAVTLLALGVLALVSIGGSLRDEDEPRADLGGAGIEAVLRRELERDIGRFISGQERLADGADLGGVTGLVPIDEGGEEVQLGGRYVDQKSSEEVALVVATYETAAAADEAFDAERADRGGTFSRQQTPSGLLATIRSDTGEVSMVWHVDTVLFVITAEETATVQQFFDQLPEAVRLGPL